MSGLKTHVYILLGTGQDEKQATARATLPYLIATCANVTAARIFPGPGTPEAIQLMENSSYLGRFITRIAIWYDQIWDTSMSHNILDAWLAMDGVENDDVIIMGCSRGGFSAQILGQVVEYHGYAASADYRAKAKEISRGVVVGRPDEPKGRIKALYALDPVGTSGINTPPTFLGFDSNRLARAVERARVILMFGERRVPFKPNIYHGLDDPTDLKQIWFEGVHGDAWGPSILSLNVLAYVLHDLGENNIEIDEDRLRGLLLGWTGAASVGVDHLKLTMFGDRSELPVPTKHFQMAHWTLPRDTEENVMEMVEQENKILQWLKEIVDKRSLS